MPIRTIADVKVAVDNWQSSPIIVADLVGAAYFELCTFLPWDQLPERYLNMLKNSKDKPTKEIWDKDFEEITVESITNDLKDELKFDRKIIDAPDNACFWRFPRALILMWVRGDHDDVVQNLSMSMVKSAKAKKISREKVKNLIKTLERNV